MGKPTGFLDYERETAKALDPKVRIADFHEFRILHEQRKTETSGSQVHGLRRAFLPVGDDDRRNGVRLSPS